MRRVRAVHYRDLGISWDDLRFWMEGGLVPSQYNKYYYWADGEPQIYHKCNGCTTDDYYIGFGLYDIRQGDKWEALERMFGVELSPHEMYVD